VDISIGGGGATGVTQLVAGDNITLTNSAGQASNGTGVVTINATGGGGGGTPGTPPTSIQFNDNGSFGGDNLFVYDKANDRVGIGIASGMQRRLHINDTSTGGAIIRLQANITADVNKQAFLEIGKGSLELTQIGKLNGNSNDTYIHQFQQLSTVQTGPNIGKTHFSFGSISSITATVTEVGIGIGTIGPNRDLSILSDSTKGIGITGGGRRGVENRIRILPDVWQKTFVDNSGNELEGINRYGLGIHTPIPAGGNGGNMLIAVSDTGEGINELRDPNRLLITAYNSEEVDDSLDGVPVHIASFTAAGRVGIHTPDPNKEIRLDINGQYRGAYLEQENDYNLDFKNYSVIKVTDNVGGYPMLGINGNVPPAGTKAVLILSAPIKAVEIQLLSTPNLVSGGNLYTEVEKYSTITFVSDGTNLFETSRTANMD
jgi:hypothetical protein